MKKTYSNEAPELVLHINPVKNIWQIAFDVKEVEENKFEYLTYEFRYKPTLDEIKTLIIDYYNKLCDYEITSGFIYEGMSVWLSTENQMNYKAAYDVQVQSNGVTLKERPLKFKFGTNDNPQYKVFDNLEELTDFYLNALYYIQSTLNKYWDIKDNIDWSKYEI